MAKNNTAAKHGIGWDHFSAATRRALTKKGIRIYGLQGLPGKDGSFANGETGYLLDDNGTGRVMTHGQVRALAESWRYQNADGTAVHSATPTDARGLRLRAESGYTHVHMGTADGWLQISVAIRKVEHAERLAALRSEAV